MTKIKTAHLLTLRYLKTALAVLYIIHKQGNSVGLSATLYAVKKPPRILRLYTILSKNHRACGFVIIPACVLFS